MRSWPTYLLRDIPPDTRAALEEEAETDGVPLIEIIRGILCSHYSLDCAPVGGRRTQLKEGTGTMVLRLQPDLWEAIKADAGKADTHYGTPRGAIDAIIHGALAAHYNGGTPNGN